MFDNSYIKSEYHRHLSLVQNEGLLSEKYIDYSDVLKAHFLIIDFFSSTTEKLTHGVKDFNLLGSALGRQVSGYGHYLKWKKPEEICATLFYGLIMNHAFHDANKRTALLTLLYHLLKFGRTIDCQQKEFENLAVAIANDTLNEFPGFKRNIYQKHEDKEIIFISDFIRKNTRDLEKRYYPVTYQEFDGLLRRHGFYMEITGAFANIIGTETRSGFLGLSKVSYHKRYIQVGFMGWKRQINARAVKEILKAVGLTAENGVDSKVFFKDAEPLTALIDQYKGPLIRLKDK